MIGFSPGLAQGCFELLTLATRQQLTFAEIKCSFAYLGGLPSQRVVETAQALNWLQTGADGRAQLTPGGERLLAIYGYEAQLRQALLDYIDIEHPSWVQNASFGRSRVLSFAGSQIAQVFVEAGLASGTDDAAVAFWDALAARARGQRDDKFTAIGRLGERLTLKFETTRTGRQPTWVSIDNNADGYDVLSVVDSFNPKQLTIEVKTSTQGVAGIATFTRNEWEMAKESESHAFYFWDVKHTDKPKLAIIQTETMLQHVPLDCGRATWESARIPFSAFSDAFEICE
ncbi:DUF3883 domain-containing protein [Burkholderiaceae bacterium UC74_6]